MKGFSWPFDSSNWEQIIKMKDIEFPIKLPQNHLDGLNETVKDCGSHPRSIVLGILENFVDDNGIQPPAVKVIISKLHKQRSSFNDSKVKHLRLFGSVARGEAGKGSDIDLMADFGGSVELSNIIEARMLAEKSIGREYKIDLVAKYKLKDEIIDVAQSEGIEIF